MDLVYATLTPANSLARLALSDTYDTLMARGQDAQDKDNVVHRMQVQPTREYDADVYRLQREVQRRLHKGDGFSSDSLSDAEGDVAISNTRDLGMIWTGRYLLSFEPGPLDPEFGWTAGKQQGHVDLLLCTTTFDKVHGVNLRSMHARFNFDRDNRAFFIAGKSDPRRRVAKLSVNGDVVSGKQHTLNQHSMPITFGQLNYVLQYTDWAETPAFMARLETYMTTFLKAPSVIDFEMPTPASSVRTLGQWTLSKPLGRGASGKVFLASNSSNEMVAVKIVEWNSRTARSVDREVHTFRQLAKEDWDGEDDKRIVCLREVIGYPGDNQLPSSTPSPFQEVAIIMVPVTRTTLSNLIDPDSASGDGKGMTKVAAGVLRSAMLGANAMHKKGWLHGDLKPANIGLIGLPQRAILLDIGHAAQLRPGSTLDPTPGCGGTLGYIAPEREMERYGHAVDVWSLGIIGFELTYGFHPWRFAQNPWRNDWREGKDLRLRFDKAYEDAIEMLTRDASEPEPSNQHIQLGSLLVQMLRHSWAPDNHDRRISIQEALDHEAWGSLLPDTYQEPKRSKQDHEDKERGKSRVNK